MLTAGVHDVWITKYALTSGVEKVRAIYNPAYPGSVAVERGVYRQYLHGEDWKLTEEDALNRADKMRLKKIAALEKQIARLQKLEVKVVTRQ